MGYEAYKDAKLPFFVSFAYAVQSRHVQTWYSLNKLSARSGHSTVDQKGGHFFCTVPRRRAWGAVQLHVLAVPMEGMTIQATF